MRKSVFLSMLVVLLFSGCGEGGNEDSVSIRLPFFYDDFSLPSINTSKWTLDTSGGGEISVGNGVANLSVNTAGINMQSTLLFPPALASKIGTVGVRVNPTNYFEDGPSSSNVRFRITTRAYKDNLLGGGGAFSDIFPQLRLRNFQFQAIVSRCTHITCGTSTIFVGPVVLGTVNLNRYYDLSLSYDGGTSFSFVVDGVGSTVLDASVGGTFTKIAPPGAPRALVEVKASSGSPTIGNMTTLLDHVICVRLTNAPC